MAEVKQADTVEELSVQELSVHMAQTDSIIFELTRHINSFRGKPYADSALVVADYILQINQSLHSLLSRSKLAFPFQFDAFMVSPKSAIQRKVSDQMLKCADIFAQSDEKSRHNGAIDGVADMFQFLSRNIIACRDQFQSHRLILLIVRQSHRSTKPSNNEQQRDSSFDELYLLRTDDVIAKRCLSDNIELNWLSRSRADIVNVNAQATDDDELTLTAVDQGVFGLCHHLHSAQCAKVFMSYGAHKSRVFIESHSLLTGLYSVMNVWDRTRDSGALVHRKMNERTRIVNSLIDYRDFADEDLKVSESEPTQSIVKLKDKVQTSNIHEDDERESLRKQLEQMKQDIARMKAAKLAVRKKMAQQETARLNAIQRDLTLGVEDNDDDEPSPFKKKEHIIYKRPKDDKGDN